MKFNEETAALSGFNIVGEIPGTDLKDEIVLLGAHFDSWHASTGATDNAAGSAAMMEAMRILKASGVRLRRTVPAGQALRVTRSALTRHYGFGNRCLAVRVSPAR